MVREKKYFGKKRNCSETDYNEQKALRVKKGIRGVWGIAALAVSAMLTFTACAGLPWGNGSEPQPSPTPGRADTGFVAAGPDSYDSADTTVLVAKNEDDSTLTFLNLTVGKRYTLSMDGTTRLYDKYGESISLEQVEPGDVVDITFLKSKKHLTTLQKSRRAWSQTNVERYEINTARGEISIGSGIYKLTSNTQYFSGNENIEIMDISSTDVLSFQGIDSQILTVCVEKGHGFLRLANYEDFVGGWIEIGQKQIERITEGMLLVVPEGSYKVNVSHKGGSGTADVVIGRGEETVLDVGDFDIQNTQKGSVLFSLSPSGAELYIDGARKDASRPVALEYGLHQVVAKAAGYHSITQYIRVDKDSTKFNIKLDEIQQEGTGSTDSNTSNASGSTPDSSSGSASGSQSPGNAYMVRIEAPEGVEVYLDGNYVGVSPCSFQKVPGIHVIILRKAGYETRSYTIQVDDEEKDSSYSFVELAVSGEPEEGEDEEEDED